MIGLFIIAGRTATGKDTIARYLEDKYGIKPIVSYATRPMRAGEVNGREHKFITTDEMTKLQEVPEELLAYTMFPDTWYEYCAVTSDLEDGGIYSYILNPDGIAWLQEHRKDVTMVIVGLDLDPDEQLKRALLRGDDPDLFESRRASEDEQFTEFLLHADNVVNTACSKQEVFSKIDKYVEELRSRLV